MQLAIILQKSSGAVLAIIGALLSYQLALLTWHVASDDKPAFLWKPPAVSDNQKQNQLNTQNLQQQHLFGKKEIATVVTPEVVTSDNAPKTKLNLKLAGIVAATDPQYSSVIIEQQGRQGSYFINSKIDGTSAIITNIYADRIILQINGSHQTLMLDGVEQLDKQNEEQQRNTENVKNEKRAEQQKAVSATAKNKVKTVALDRAALLKNPSSITELIQISPVREDGKIKGYRVRPGKNGELFKQAGLQSGDLAVQLNGIDLTDMQQALSLMKEFPTMTEMSLTVERSGQLHELYLSIP